MWFLAVFMVFPLFAARIEVSSNGTMAPEALLAVLQNQVLNFEVTEFKPSNDVKKRSFKEIQKFVFMNVPMKGSLNLHNLPKEKMVLFMWEPPLRLGRMYKKKTQDSFGKIYTWDDDLVDNKTYFKFYYPVLCEMVQDIVPFEKKRFCTMIVGCTSDKKNHRPEQLYSERKKAIAFFEAVGEEGFVFYGTSWDPAKYKSYRGPVENKIEVMKQYRFAICYENTNNAKGYITEKIFDCFTAGVIPIYWGAPNVEKYIPKGCFIDRRDFTSMDELYKFLKKMTKEEYEGYIERIKAYLRSDQAQLFSFDNFEKIFCEAVL